jgi:predicted signal transduction protein with EAL and GGDEF domain
VRLAEPIELGGTSVTIGASVGYTASRLVTADFDRLVNEADFAMRRAKIEGNHAAQAHDESMGYRATGAHVVIEGVERPEQLDFLRQLDPCLVQGFVYSRPVAADEFLAMLAEQPWLVREA